MKIITINNSKGGSCKSTTSVNLSAALAEKKKRVLLIDLDPQSSSSSWLACQSEGKGIFNVFAENTSISDIIRKTKIDGLDVIPGSPWLVGADKLLSSEAGAEMILKHQLKKVGNQWDYIIIDTLPSVGILNMNALAASTHVIIPVEVGILALDGLVNFTKMIGTIRERLNPDLDILGVLASRVDKRTRLSKDVLNELKKRLGDKLIPVHIRENIKLKESPSFKQPITLFDPKGAGAEDFRALAKFVIEGKL